MGNFMRLGEVVYQALKYMIRRQNLGQAGPALPQQLIQVAAIRC
jgi:hypothetical protein